MEEQESGSFSRYRSPAFPNSEVQLLVSLVDKYKNPILIKSTLKSVTYYKDKAWEKLTREFNEQKTCKDYERSTDVLRTKWDNLKRMTKRQSKSDQFHNDILQKVITVCELDVGSSVNYAPDDYEDGEGALIKNELHNRIVRLIQTKLNEGTLHTFENEFLDIQNKDSENMSLASYNTGSQNTNNNLDSKEQNIDACESKPEIKAWDCNVGDSSDGEHLAELRDVVITETDFSARDCRLLLHCVRQEKNVLFSTSHFARKQKAWARVARLFNRQSPTKRSSSELKKKFQNLKSMASRVNSTKKIGDAVKRKKYEQLTDAEDGVQKKVKSEPKSDDFDLDNDEDPDDGSQDSTHLDALDDPLSNGVSADPELSTSRDSESKDLDKLRRELLIYEMETAKLQRKRLEDAIAAEKAERDARAVETALRIRSARLELISAECKLPASHHALSYTPEEAKAQQYMSHRVT